MKPDDQGATIPPVGSRRASARRMEAGALENPTTTGLGQKLFYSHMSVAAVGIVILSLLLTVTISGMKYTREMGKIDAPLTKATAQTLTGLHRSLATLRLWMLTGNPQAKAARELAWRDLIYPNFKTVQDLSSMERKTSRGRNLEKLLSDLKYLELRQWFIEDVAGAEGNEPVRMILKDNAVPLYEEIIAYISSMKQLERRLPATTKRMALLGLLEDFQRSLTGAHHALRSYIPSGDQGQERIYRQALDTSLNHLMKIQSWVPLFEVRVGEPIEEVADLLKCYEVINERGIGIRKSETWNLAKSWMEKQAAPLAREIDTTLQGLSSVRFQRWSDIRVNLFTPTFSINSNSWIKF